MEIMKKDGIKIFVPEKNIQKFINPNLLDMIVEDHPIRM